MKDLKGTDYKTELDPSFAAEVYGDDYDKDTAAEERAQKWRYQEIRGKFGVIFPFNEDLLAVTVVGKNPSKLTRLKFKRIQRGDWEHTFLFDWKDLSFIANFIEAKRKRVLSEEHRAKFVNAGKVKRFKAKIHGSNTPISEDRSADSPAVDLR